MGIDRQKSDQSIHNVRWKCAQKCARFTEGVTEIRQPSKYKIILFENLCNEAIMVDLKILISITINTLKFLKNFFRQIEILYETNYYVLLKTNKKFQIFCIMMEVHSKISTS